MGFLGDTYVCHVDHKGSFWVEGVEKKNIVTIHHLLSYFSPLIFKTPNLSSVFSLPTTTTILPTMNFQAPSPCNDSWSPSCDLFSHSLVLDSISEEAETLVGYMSNFSSFSSGLGTSRKSCMSDLSSLGTSGNGTLQEHSTTKRTSPSSSADDEPWGFFAEA